MHHSSFIEISKGALRTNLEFIRSVIGNDCTYSSVVKGNAYGHGIDTFIPMAVACGVRHFSVFSTAEAEEVYNLVGSSCQIMIMGMIDEEDLEWVIQREIHFFIFELKRLESTIQTAKSLGKKAHVHLELDTGMNRTGFDQKELKKVVEMLQGTDNCLDIYGLCTHLAGAESIANHVRIQNQLKQFNRNRVWFNKQGIHPVCNHTACSAATISYKKSRMDMVRIGIMQYGFWPSKETMIGYLSRNHLLEDPLKQVISWKSKIMSIHQVKTGEFIGYGTSYMAENEMKIAIVPVGYSHGYSRSLSNQGRILINGKRISVIGVVNMNMLIADISHAPDTKIGDEVVLIGKQEGMAITVSSFSELTDQLNYELLTRLSREIPRIETP